MRLRVTLIVGLLLLSSQPAHSSSPSFNPTAIDYPGTAVVFHTSEPLTNGNSLLSISDQGREGVGDGRTIFCSSTTDPDCPFDSRSSGAKIELPVCREQGQEFCIESLEMGRLGGELSPATFIKQLSGLTIDPNPAMDFPGGQSAGIWEATTVEHVGGTKTYFVSAAIDMQSEPMQGKFTPRTLNVSVIPFSRKMGEFEGDRWLSDEEVMAQVGVGQWVRHEKRHIPPVRQGRKDPDCFFSDNGYCGVRYDFADDVKVSVSVRVPKAIGGWFNGRMRDPKISVTPLSATSNRLSVEAAPVEVPQLVYITDFNRLSESDQRLYDEYFWGGAPPGDLRGGPAADSGEYAFRFVSALKERVGDTIAGSVTAWNFTSVNSNSDSQCLADTSKVLGIVTTNAMTYERGSPTFDGQTLNYRVAGLHYKPDRSTRVRGTYDLLMRSETARCLYGFTNAPISATVSVTGEAGQVDVEATTVSEAQGWLKLGAYGFTFSQPTVRVRINQVAVETATTVNPVAIDTPTVGAEAVVNKAPVATSPRISKRPLTLTCKRGNLTRVISRNTAKCPKGFVLTKRS